MKTLLHLILLFLAIQLSAQEEKTDHLLNGTTLIYHYENETMGSVQAEFIDGQFKFKFIKGTYAGAEDIIPYWARKIGNQMYMVSALNKANSNFVTFVFNFEENTMYSSVIVEPRTENEMVLFEKGSIEKSTLNEN